MAETLLSRRGIDNLRHLSQSEVTETDTNADVCQGNEDVPRHDQGEHVDPSRLTKFFVASPYITKPHLLDLNTLNPLAHCLAITLVDLRPSSTNYALRPFSIAFNWEELFTIRLPALITSKSRDIDMSWPVGQTQLFHVVYFRSTLHKDANREFLSELDEESHAEAAKSGGLLKYWFGSPNEQRRNMATCIWRSREDAIEGGKGPWHLRARQAASQLYEEFEFRRLWLRLRRDEYSRIEWSFIDSGVSDSADAI